MCCASEILISRGSLGTVNVKSYQARILQINHTSSRAIIKEN
jgi:hypothetical protein